MKLPVLTSLFALATLGVSQAGSFGGPGPFSNLSPLQSGIDGSYQATARGENLTGVIRFGYSQGVQTPIPSANTYVIFVNGNVLSGGVTASITGKELAGVLGGSDFTVPTNSEGNVELPSVFVVRGSRANGFFEGSMDLEDRMSAFSGNGQITGSPAETNTIVLIDEPQVGSLAGNFSGVTIESFVIPGGTIERDPNATFEAFTFEGVRTSVVAQGSFEGGTSAQ